MLKQINPALLASTKTFFMTLILLKSLIYIRISKEFFFWGGGGGSGVRGKNFY